MSQLQCLEVQSELTNVVTHFVDGVGAAGGGGGGGVGGWVAGVPDVGVVL